MSMSSLKEQKSFWDKGQLRREASEFLPGLHWEANHVAEFLTDAYHRNCRMTFNTATVLAGGRWKFEFHTLPYRHTNYIKHVLDFALQNTLVEKGAVYIGASPKDGFRFWVGSRM